MFVLTFSITVWGIIALGGIKSRVGFSGGAFSIAFFYCANLKIRERIKLLSFALGLNKKSASVNLTDAAGFKNTFGDYLNNYFGAGTNVGYIASCSNVWGRSFAKTKFRLYDSSLDNKEITKHIVLDIFKKPNPFNVTWWEYKYRIATDFIFEGNSYFLKLRDGMQTVKGIYQLHADRLATYPYGVEQFEYYEYNTGRDIIKIDPLDIIHLRYPSRKNFIKGDPLINEMRDIIDVEQLQQQYRKQFYTKGGFYGPMFTTDTELDENTYNNLFNTLKEKFAGSANAFNFGIFHSGLKPVPTAYSLKDMQMSDERALNQKEISSHFGVNKLLLGESDLVQRGNADTIIYLFNSQVIDPLMEYVDDCLNLQWIQRDYDTDYFIKHDTQAGRDVEQDLKYYENGLKYGWLAVNEVRSEEGFDPVKDDAFDIPKPISAPTINQPVN